MSFLLLFFAIFALSKRDKCFPSDSLVSCTERQCNITIYNELNFRDQVPILSGPDADYTFFSAGSYVANDGVLAFGSGGGTLNSNPFMLTIGPNPLGFLDHLKYLIFHINPMPIPAFGSATVEMIMSAETFKTSPNPFPSSMKVLDDLRYASSAFTVFDSSTGLVFDFLITNDRIYAYYERLATARGSLGNYFAFSYAIPVLARKPNDMHRLSITLDADSRSVLYKINDKLVLAIDNIGMPYIQQFMVNDLGGTPVQTFPSSVTFGFGTLTLLDFYPACKNTKLRDPEIWQACGYPRIPIAFVKLGDANAPTQYNPITGPTTLAMYWDAQCLQQNRLWGQGVIVNLQKLVAFTKQCK